MPSRDNLGRPGGDRNILVGDLVIAAVADHYAIGAMLADGKTQASLGSQRNRTEALQLACGLAGAKHRVFLYGSAGTNDYQPIRPSRAPAERLFR
jgi:hypothetical protein